MIRFIFILLFIFPALAQNTAKYPEAVAALRDLLVARDMAESKTTAAVTSTDLMIPVENGSVFAANSSVVIGTEQILICSISGNTLNVCSGGRGFNGTVAQNHASGRTVEDLTTSYHHNQLVAEMIATQNALGANLSKVPVLNRANTFAGSNIFQGLTTMSGNARTPTLTLTETAPNEGGQLDINGATGFTGWNIDSYQNDLRLFTHQPGATPDVQLFNTAGNLNMWVGGHLDVSGNLLLRSGSDILTGAATQGIRMYAAPAAGGYDTAIQMFGKDHPSLPGQIYLDAGNNVNAATIFRTAGSQERMRLNHAGNLLLGSATDVDPTYKLQVTGGVRAQKGLFSSPSAGIAFPYSGVEIREVNYAGQGTGDPSEAPRLAFHWANRVATSLVLAGDGALEIRDNPGTAYGHMRLGNLVANGAVYAAALNMLSAQETGQPISSIVVETNSDTTIHKYAPAEVARTLTASVPKQFSFGWQDPNTALPLNVPTPEVFRATSHNATVTEITCSSDTGDAVINLYRNDDPVNGAIRSANMTCGNAWNGTTYTDQWTGYVWAPAPHYGFLMKVISGTAKKISVTGKYTASH